MFDKAAALMHSLILNHAFVDGNKRTGTAAMLVFLETNRYQIHSNSEELENLVMGIESKKFDIQEIASWLKSHSTPF
jgi:death-on-curing protein